MIASVSLASRSQVHRVPLRLLALLCLLAAVVVPVLANAAPAWAHPLGNFTVNRYSRIELDSQQVRVRYVLDMAEIPTFQEMDSIDLDHDGQVSDSEGTAYSEKKSESLRQALQLTVDGKPIPLAVAPQPGDLKFLPGQGGLQILHLSVWFQASLPDHPVGHQYQLAYTDNNYLNRLGWKEIVVQPGSGTGLLTSTAPSEDSSNELLSYPQGLLKSPLDVTTAQVSFKTVPLAPGEASANAASQPQTSTVGKATDPLVAPLQKSDNGFAALIAKGKLTIPVIALALLVAMFWGAMHALSPGHGKTVVAAYLVGSKGTIKHAVFLALTVTVTHTSSVFALGLIALFASRYILPEQLFPWLGLASGLMVVGLGIWLLYTRLRHAGLLRLPWRRKLAFAPAVAGGSEGFPLMDTPHAHDEGHERDHGHGFQQLGPDHDHLHEHSHGDGHTHSHLPPGAEGSKVSWKTLLALGISGGLLPCPSAIVVMLSAVALDRIAFGLVLVIAFSFGLAAALGAIGLLVLYGRKLLDRSKVGASLTRSSWGSRVVRLFPVGSAAIIAVAGVVLTSKAITQIGF